MYTIDKHVIEVDSLESKVKGRSLLKGRGIVSIVTILSIFLILSFTVIVNAETSESIKVLLREKKDESFLEQEKEKSYLVQNSKDWMLMLVNEKSPLPDGYLPKLKKLENGLEFDERAIDYLNEMLADARLQGLSPVVCSASRTVEYQQKLFDNQVKKQMGNGLSIHQAVVEAKKVVAYPGTSEHNLGLAVDIVSLDYQILDEKQATTPEIQWLVEHCSEYGFILRYPKDKTEITGVIYEPWHFRYVGKQAAKEIMENGLCLEEYLIRY
ncbi:M15 family metallopeptidase [Tissierella pigra]|uniref:M15 family metallopeptidase n=1 Tax=Tissierella pigra TaxID=2607614 RepID=UPI001C1024E6|nr:M15 family metallopeptidase [Tissierella pigra]